MRLDKFLANENIGSRKAVGVLVRSGAVTVNGQAVKKADMQVDPACDTVCVNGAPVRYNAHIYIMMNKPAGVLTATRDSRAETVLDLPAEAADKTRFAAGIRSGEDCFAPALLEISPADPHTVWVEIREGKFHQVKRMFRACGKTVTALRRLSIGALRLDPALGPGEARILSEKEAMLVFEKKLEQFDRKA